MANLFKAELGILGPMLSQLHKAGFTAEMLALIAAEDGEYARVVHDAVRARMNGVATQPVVSAETSLPLNHYRVRMTYAPMPSFPDLEIEFGEGRVPRIFDGRPFKLHASCVGMDRTPGEKVFYAHNTDDEWESEERIAWGLRQCSSIAPNGYRPTTHEETYEFIKINPWLGGLASLGSFEMRDDVRYGVEVLVAFDGRPLLRSHWFDRRWSAGCRSLFVCK